jgi:uncharacterized membrane protein YhaH (DUF805 family)
MKKYFIDVIKNHYFDFEGTTDAKSFWMFFGFSFLINIVLGLIDWGIGWDFLSEGILCFIFQLAILLPFLGIGARRLHDSGKSGWWWLIALVPFIGWIILIIFWVMPSKQIILKTAS